MTLSQMICEELLAYAFDKIGAFEIHNDFESTREAALKTHLAVGFTEIARCDNGIIELSITKPDWHNKIMER